MKIFQKAALAAAISVGIALTGCSSSDDNPNGGGGGGGGYTVSGAAVKGVLKNAKVTAYELTENGDRKAGTVGTVRTNDKGEYTLSLTSAYTDGVLDIQVEADDQTRMVCDAEKCGEVEKGKDLSVTGLTLNSLVVKEKGANASDVPVTAWTAIAASLTIELAKNQGISSAHSQAASEVNQLAGFDVANTKAIAITEDLKNASEAEQQAAIMNAVVANMMTGGFKAEELKLFS